MYATFGDFSPATTDDIACEMEEPDEYFRCERKVHVRMFMLDGRKCRSLLVGMVMNTPQGQPHIEIYSAGVSYFYDTEKQTLRRTKGSKGKVFPAPPEVQAAVAEYMQSLVE